MSQARPILAGHSYLVTRRTTQRMFLLRPSPEVNGAVRYCLALAARRTGIDLHVVVAMSNHYHLVLTDPQARLPEFTSYFNGLLARCLNCHHGRWEGFWASGQQASYVSLEDERAVLAKSVYALLNPVEAGLVKDFRDWPGELLVQPGTYKAVKPRFFFRSTEDKGGLPDSVKLTITAPPVAATVGERMSLLYGVARAYAANIVAERKRKGLGFLGAAAVRRQRWHDSPASPAPRRTRSPRVATRDKWRRVEAIQRDQAFVDAHRAARRRWLADDRDVVWPVGTYQMRRVHNVRCAPASGP